MGKGRTISAINSSATIPSTITDGTPFSLSVTVQDASGNAVSGLTTSDFSLNAGTQTLAPIQATLTDATTGVYDLLFNPTTLPPNGSVSVSLSVDGTSVGVNPVVAIDAGSAVAAKSSAVFPTGTSLNTGATYTNGVTVTLEDAYGNPVALTAAQITAGASLGGILTGTGTVSAVPNTTNEYYVNFTAPASITSVAKNITVTLGGVTFTSPNKYAVANQTAATVASTWTGLPSTLTQGGSYTVPVTVNDASGNAVGGLGLASFGMTYTASGSSTTTAVSVGNVTPGSTLGSYNVTFTAPITSATSYTLAVSVGAATSSASPSYTPGSTTVTSSSIGSASTVKWPTSLASGAASTITATLVDANGNPFVLPTVYSLKLEQTAGSVAGTNIPAAGASVALTAGSTIGQYTLSVTPTNGTGNFEVVLLNGTTFVSQVGSSQTFTIQAGAVSGATAGAVPVSFNAVAGQSYTVPVLVEDANGNSISGLGASNFAVSYGAAYASATQLSGFSVKDNTANVPGQYLVTLTLPSTATSNTLYISANNTELGTGTAVTVAAVAAVAPTSNAATTTEIAADSSAPSGIVLAPATGSALQAGQPYALTVSLAVTDQYLTPSDFTVTYGSATTNLVQSVVSTGTAGQYLVIFNAPATASNVAQALNVNVASNSMTSTFSYSVQVPVSATSSSVTWFGGSSLIAGQTGISFTANVVDAAGNPVTGLSTSDVQLQYGSTNITPSTVTAGSTSGQYTIMFTAPTSVNATPTPFKLVVNPQGVSNTASNVTIGTSGNFTITAGTYMGAVATSVIGGAALSPLATSIQTLYGVTASKSYTITLQAEDAYGNPLTSGTVYATFTPAGTNNGTLTTGATPITTTPVAITLNSNGQATLTYSAGTSFNGDAIALGTGVTGGTTLTGTYDTITA